MAQFNEVDFKLFGLQHEKNGAVRADVFAKKLSQFIKGLKATDKHINGKKSLNYLITDLKHGSAEVRISEQQISTNRPIRSSSIGYFQDTIADIRDGKKLDRNIPAKVLETIASLGDGSKRDFSHGEIDLVGKTDNLVRFDDFFDRQAEKILTALEHPEEKNCAYAGAAYVEYSGVVKAVDLRGKIAKAKLLLTAGGAEIDCVCNSVSVDNLAAALDHKVTVSAKAFYDGVNKLPERLDIKKIRLLKSDANLARWEAKFHIETNEQSRAL